MYDTAYYIIGDNDQMLGPDDQLEPDQLSPQSDAAISLPASLFERIDDRDDVGVFFALHEASNLFPVGVGLGDSSNTLNNFNFPSVGSHILAVTIGVGINFQNLDEPVSILFRLQITNNTVSRTVKMSNLKENIQILGLLWYMSIQIILF